MTEPINEPNLETRRRRLAEQEYLFLKEVIADVEDQPAEIDHDRLLAYMDAFRSPYFMRFIEEDPDLPFEIKTEIAKMVSGLSKTWSYVSGMVYSDQGAKFAAIALRMLEMQARILLGLGVRRKPNTLPAGEDELRPMELPPGDPMPEEFP